MAAEKKVTIRIAPEELTNTTLHRDLLAKQLGIPASDIFKFVLRRRSLDARGHQPRYELQYEIFLSEKTPNSLPFSLKLQNVANAEPVIIVGMGPAGMFAALRLIELGFKPIILERGKEVRARRLDLAQITKHGEVNPESNYCFGEGGAGTFSDGKLYTRSTKRGSVERILNILVLHGADPDILIDAHPHIGTNKLPKVVQAVRATILSCGGEVLFNSAMKVLKIENGKVAGVVLKDSSSISAKAVMLATGHSARDIYYSLKHQNVLLERKPFSLGVRVEHPQMIVDELQYHSKSRHPNLPAAAYSFVSQCDGRGVFSFCMCPGGIICPAATAPNEIVVNGWSPSSRNSKFANSGIVVEVKDEDLTPFASKQELAGIALQQSLEERAFELGGGAQRAHAQRLTDLLENKSSQSLPQCSYIPGLTSASLAELFPPPILSRLIDGFKSFDEKRRGFVTSEAVVVAVESRTSSPVRIPRDPKTRFHPQIFGLAPVGEGAGYAGGIVSAAIDGEVSAQAVAEQLCAP